MADAETPLARKLGIKPGVVVVALGGPANFPALLAPMPTGATLRPRLTPGAAVFVCFGASRAAIDRRFEAALAALPADGGLWLAYPKASSGMRTDLTFGVVQRFGLEAGLVDNKSCAIDATWTALRFVVPLARRPTWPTT